MTSPSPPFYANKHIEYIKKVANDKDSFEYYVTQQFRMSGVYWGLTALSTLGRDLHKELDIPPLVEWIFSCQHECGGFSADVGHDAHILYTLSAIQILALCGSLDRLDKKKVASFISTLQQEDGSFFGDKWGEVDTRFSYCSVSALSLMGMLHEGHINVDKATAFIAKCRNFDGGFGAVPDAESHAAQVFCCVGALSICNALHYVDIDLLGWWLSERQCDSGGLNGRPEKQADVCYSWWILSCLRIIGRDNWINKGMLVHFILDCQDSGSKEDEVHHPPAPPPLDGASATTTAENAGDGACTEDFNVKNGGGIAERPGNMADIFHTFFGIAGLSLLEYFNDNAIDAAEGTGAASAGGNYPYGFVPSEYQMIDPTYALPVSLLQRMGVTSQVNTEAGANSGGGARRQSQLRASKQSSATPVPSVGESADSAAAVTAALSELSVSFPRI